MKTANLKKAGALALLSAATFTVASPLHAQAIAPDLANEAKTACIDKAKADGYTLKDIVSVEPYDATGDRVRVVLNLEKGGAAARLTCGYTKGDRSVAFDAGQAADTARDTAQGVNPWLWLLLPLIAIPLLLGLTRGRQRAATYDNYATRTPAERTEGFVRTNGEALDVYSGPGTTYRVTGSLRNGDRVVLTGRKENNWLELENGGWIPAQYVETSYRTI
jgi:uncharacterized protein YgiM (DUF1202 family)